jgi:soluble lytic murein transglycosylase-like protein
MAYSKLLFEIPDVNRTFTEGKYSYSNPVEINNHIKMLERVSKTYEKQIKLWGKESGFEENIVSAMICTESGGQNAGKNSFGAIGLMQVTAPTVYEVITKWSVFVDVPLSTTSKAILSKNIPSWKNWDRNRKITQIDINNIENALRNVDFNIAMGCLSLRWNVEGFAIDGESHINKPIVAYNAGFYGARQIMRGLKTTQQILNSKKLRKETRGYLLKMLGVNGFLDIWFKNLK